MSLSATVIKLLLLVIVTGNLSLVVEDHDPFMDVEAVAEWRLDPDTVDEDAGAEPPEPALVGLFRETIAVAVAAAPLPLCQPPFTIQRVSACTTRAPPHALWA